MPKSPPITCVNSCVSHSSASPRSELVELDATESLFGEPEAVIWADGTWLLRFAESRLEMADPFGIGVLFAGTTPYAVEDLSGAEPV